MEVDLDLVVEFSLHFEIVEGDAAAMSNHAPPKQNKTYSLAHVTCAAIRIAYI